MFSNLLSKDPSLNPAQSKLPLGTTIGGLLSGGNGGVNLFTLAFFVIGMAFFFSLLTAGFQFISSAGNPQNIQSASTRIMNSLLGLVITLASYMIVRVIAAMIGLPSGII